MNDNDSEVRVRFAPSPTGYLHVGGARTAIFNWLFAKQQNGEFLIRIEDTDLERSEQAMVDNILNSLEWLGLSPDEDVVYQSENFEAHQKAVQQLLESGNAYRCFCDPAALDAKRQNNSGTGQDYQYDGTCRNLSGEEIEAHLANGDPFAVRFKVRRNGPVRFKDRIYKKMKVETSEIDDFIIQRRDGTPVYQLAVVVDDAAMEISHVIRGEDHLSNTPKQILLYLALGYPVPKFAHLPLIVGSDGKRLSKRHGATSVEEYQKQGYLYTAVVNYLALLGWTPKSNDEIFLPDELIQQFDMLRISKKSAAFDQKKLDWVSSQHFNLWENEDLLPLVMPLWLDASLVEDADSNTEYALQVIDLLKPKVTTLHDFVNYGRYFWEDPTEYDPKALEKYWDEPVVTDRMKDWLKRLQELENPDKDEYEQRLRDLADEKGWSAADLIHPTRIALTGFSVSPGIFKVMDMLGHETVIRRIQRATQIIAK